jgi:hypothetical protein
MASQPTPSDERQDRRGTPPGAGTQEDPRGPGTGRIGNPPHEVTDELRARVQNLAAGGSCQEDMALILGMSVDTLQRHYRLDMDLGKAKAVANMGQRIYQMGMAGNVAAAIFYQKTQGRWKEAKDGDEPPPVNPDIAPAQINITLHATPALGAGSNVPNLREDLDVEKAADVPTR